MTIEAGVLVGLDEQPIHWHLPSGRSAVYLPDSRELWDVIWENRDNVLGFAHSHPGSGWPAPSWEDITTFRAVDAALGKRLMWWITSSNQLVLCIPVNYKGVVEYDPMKIREPDKPWLPRLRELSNF